MITVDATDTGIRVTIPKGEVPAECLKSFLDHLRVESIARGSYLSEQEAARLAGEIKANWWVENKARFIKV